MTAIQPRMKAALRGLVSACPPDCRPVGWACVQLALLMLPSSSLIAGVLLLIAITIQRPVRQPAPLSRPQALWLLLLSALMVVGGFWAVRGWVAWVGLFNWLPFFWLFLAIQPYLATPASRTRLGQWILAGTVPVIAVSLLHKVSGRRDLLETLWGLIRWPMGDPLRGAGMFDNPNVTAAWLAITLPFLVAACLQHRQPPSGRTVSLLITATASAALMINGSRNALATLPVIGLLSCDRRGRIAVLLATLGYGGLVLLKVHHNPWPPLEPLLNLTVPNLLSSKLASMVSEAATTDPSTAYIQRPAIYAAALGYIGQHPWFGLGENGFGHMYMADITASLAQSGVVLGERIQHSHNLLLEFTLSHGVPALLILAAVIGRPLLQVLPLLWTRFQGSDRAWVLATLVMLWIHLWDLPSFDARINILDWLLVAGIACIARSGPVDSPPTPIGST